MPFFFFLHTLSNQHRIYLSANQPHSSAGLWWIASCHLPSFCFFTERGSPWYSLAEHFGSYSPSRSSEIHSRATPSQRNWDLPLCVTQRYNLVICVSLLRKLKVFQRVTLEMWTPLQMMLFLLHCTSLYSALSMPSFWWQLALSVSLPPPFSLHTHTLVL